MSLKYLKNSQYAAVHNNTQMHTLHW